MQQHPSHNRDSAIGWECVKNCSIPLKGMHTADTTFDSCASCMSVRRWESSGFFAPDPNAPGPSFTMPMPPPNVTGKLHMGHAMFVTLQVRYGAWAWQDFDIAVALICSGEAQGGASPFILCCARPCCACCQHNVASLSHGNTLITSRTQFFCCAACAVLCCAVLSPVVLCCAVRQDVMARYSRMAGKKTLWLPGTDHAGIATQVRATVSLPL
jgi:hypothetical protein